MDDIYQEIKNAAESSVRHSKLLETTMQQVADGEMVAGFPSVLIALQQQSLLLSHTNGLLLLILKELADARRSLAPAESAAAVAHPESGG